MTFYNKYKWLVPILVFTSGLIVFRIVFCFSLDFISIVWNLFLAIVPLYFSFRLSRSKRLASGFVYFMLWLLFFPNAMYIVTDLLHLKARPEIPMWYDLLLLFSAAITGVIAGYLSLYQVEQYLLRQINKRYIHLVTFLLFILCGYGVYLGRYQRRNSWDIITQPFTLMRDVRQDIVHPFRNMECWVMTLLFGVLMYILYWYFKRIRVAAITDF